MRSDKTIGNWSITWTLHQEFCLNTLALGFVEAGFKPALGPFSKRACFKPAPTVVLCDTHARFDNGTAQERPRSPGYAI
jgi:hypothetical protein